MDRDGANNDETQTRSNQTHSQNKQIKSQASAIKNSNETNIPSRAYDVVIFAASSSVGQFLVEELALVVDKYYSSQVIQQQPTATSSNAKEQLRHPSQFAQNQTTSRLGKSAPRRVNEVNWAIAGRSASLLSDTLCRAELSTGIKNLSSRVPVLLADLNHHKSLMDMCSKTNLIINCAGPYSMSGPVLIKACVENETNYIDLSHETTFIEQMRQQHSAAARRANIYIINGCGFQSMSAEIGLNFVKQAVDGCVSEVKIILNLSDLNAPGEGSNSDKQSKRRSIVSRGMWQSLLTEKAQELPVVERITGGKRRANKSGPPDMAQSDIGDSSKPLLTRKDTQSLIKDVVEFKNKDTFSWLQLLRGFDECGKGYCLPLNNITSEESQLIQGELTNYEMKNLDLLDGSWRPIRCTSFMSLKHLSDTVLFLIWMMVFNFIVKLSPLRRLMRIFPYIFSVGHVNNKSKLDRDALSHIKFCQTFLVYGTPDADAGDPLERRDKNSNGNQQLLVARIVGPEPNHVATATFAVQAALAVITERRHLPSNGGVITPGAAFSETNIIYQLRRRNIKFEVLKKA